MWDSRIYLRVHYATCQSLAQNIGKFMARQDSFDLLASKADELNDMVAAMIEQLEEVEDLGVKLPRPQEHMAPTTPEMAPF